MSEILFYLLFWDLLRIAFSSQPTAIQRTATGMRLLLRLARKPFDEITQRKFASANSVVCFYSTSSCAKNPEYEDPIGILPQKNRVISWTAKISKFLKQNQPEESIGLFKSMLLNDQKPNFVTILTLIRALGAFSSHNSIRMAHGYVIKMGFEQEVPVLTALLGFYSMFDMEVVRVLFLQIPNKDVVVWSAMVSACSRNDKYDEAIDFFRRMQSHGVEPNFVSVVSVLPACAALGELRFGKEIHGFLLKKMFYSLANVRNSLLDMYAKCREFEASIRIFHETWNKELASWRIMIRGCIDNGRPRKGLEIFLKMRYSGAKADDIVIRDIIVASTLADELKFGLGFHSYIVKEGFLDCVSVGTALLQMYGKLSKLDLSQMVFNELNGKDRIAWNAMISLYGHEGQPHNALSLFQKMQLMNQKPDEVTFFSLLRACSAMGALEIGESIHGHVTKAGYLANARLASTLIDLYCKLGRIKQGETLFNEISAKDLICWSSMIKGYGLNGCGREAFETFSNMLDHGIKPNDIVLLSVLSACSQSGLEYECCSLFYSMEESYGFAPKLAHYACMVDLLCRRGFLMEALDLVNNMPMEPDKRIWGAILAGCRSRHNRSIEVAEFVVKRLSDMDPENPSYYSCLSDLYEEEGRWEDVETLKKERFFNSPQILSVISYLMLFSYMTLAFIVQLAYSGRRI